MPSRAEPSSGQSSAAREGPRHPAQPPAPPLHDASRVSGSACRAQRRHARAARQCGGTARARPQALSAATQQCIHLLTQQWSDQNNRASSCYVPNDVPTSSIINTRTRPNNFPNNTQQCIHLYRLNNDPTNTTVQATMLRPTHQCKQTLKGLKILCSSISTR